MEDGKQAVENLKGKLPKNAGPASAIAVGVALVGGGIYALSQSLYNGLYL